MALIHDVLLVTAESHPALFKAFELISHDCGRQAGHRNYAVPLEYADKLPYIEQNLQALLDRADADFETLCIGEAEESAAVVRGYQLAVTDELLQRFFEEFS